LKFLTVILVGLFSLLFSAPPDVLDQVREDGVLRVLTRNNPTAYYEGATGPTGLEYDLAKRFADDLGVELELVVADSPGDVLQRLQHGEANFAAAGLSITPERETMVRFGPSYQEITEQLIFRQGSPRPRSPADLGGKLVEVVADSSHAKTLQHLRRRYPDLKWLENRRLDSDEMLASVWHEDIAYTVADSNEVALTQRFYPEIRVAFDFETRRSLAWAFPPHTDDSLYVAAIQFFSRIRRSGVLEQLVERHYGHIKSFDYVETRKLMKHVETRLPSYADEFWKAGTANDIDWRLLAAIGYQESHWRANAVSPTGVRGLMMLTQDTAKYLNIENRNDPVQSIRGGSKYFAQIKRRVPQRIDDPDRTWLALAAYNIGLGHLEDARKLTAQQGGDPDKWSDVKRFLPLLSQKKWYKKTKHGYARGHEATRYVENIRRYYDLLVWLEDDRNRSRRSYPHA